MYHVLFGELADDYESGGMSRDLLGTSHMRPVHDAIPLRMAATVHRLVLEGLAHPVARHYPSVGGLPGAKLTGEFLDACASNRDALTAGLALPVQTNEVGRSLVHLALARWITTLGVKHYVHLEVGASAGLTMNFLRYSAHDGFRPMGDPSSPLRFDETWFHGPLPLPADSARPRFIRGCDPRPIDLRDTRSALSLLSFVWPDQAERLTRTRTAIDLAKDHPPHVDEASADEWIEHRLAEFNDEPVMVFHSIVWQYMGGTVQKKFVDAMRGAAAGRGPANPLVWSRMEPAGRLADVRATIFSESRETEVVLAEIGYHGRGLRWLPDRSN